jgi:hypothetical protein
MERAVLVERMPFGRHAIIWAIASLSPPHALSTMPHRRAYGNATGLAEELAPVLELRGSLLKNIGSQAAARARGRPPPPSARGWTPTRQPTSSGFSAAPKVHEFRNGQQGPDGS